jgi:RNA polymerase sigma-70 factor (ECF subfamily)
VHDVNRTMPQRKDRPAASGQEPVESIDAIYDRHAPQVERWARRLAGPQFDPQDLLHDIFLVVMRRWPEFRGEAKVTTWLFRITQQVVRWRPRWRRSRRSGRVGPGGRRRGAAQHVSMRPRPHVRRTSGKRPRPQADLD